MSKKIEKDLPVKRPATLGEARRLIEETFAFNKWNKREKNVFCKDLKIVYSGQLDSESARVILMEMERLRMILFNGAK